MKTSIAEWSFSWVTTGGFGYTDGTSETGDEMRLECLAIVLIFLRALS